MSEGELCLGVLGFAQEPTKKLVYMQNFILGNARHSKGLFRIKSRIQY